jgi:peptide/nickel transport system substrate-binding protein
MSEQRDYWNRSSRRYLRRRSLLSAGLAGSAGMMITALGCRQKGGPAPAGTAAGGGSGTPRPGGSFTALLGGNPPTLDPQQTSSDFSFPIASAVMSRILRFRTGPDVKTGLDHLTEPDLAVSVESPDAMTWTVKLRSDAKFHDVPPVNGHGVEAEDVKATYVRALSQPKNPYRGLLGAYMDTGQIETPAKDTVVFKLKYPYSPFRAALASGSYAWIFPREALSGDYDTTKQVIGSGPFLFDHYTPDVEVAFRKNQDWFEKGRPLVDSLRLAIIPDFSQQEAQFSGGHLDTFLVPRNPDIPTMRQQNPKAVDVVTPPSSLGSVWFQLGNPDSPWLDIRLRQAVSMAIDRDTIGKTIFGGDYDIAFNLGANFGKWALQVSDLPPATAQNYHYDPTEAKKLIAAAGAANMGPIKLGYATPISNVNTQQIVETVNSMLQAVGFKTSIVTLDYTTVWLNGGKGVRYGNKPNDMLVLSGMETGNDADDYMYNYFGSQAPNPSRLNDPALDALILKARSVIAEEERVKAYKQVQLYIAEKVYTASGIPQGRRHQMVQPWVQNFQYSAAQAAPAESFTKLWIAK